MHIRLTVDYKDIIQLLNFIVVMGVYLKRNNNLKKITKATINKSPQNMYFYSKKLVNIAYYDNYKAQKTLSTT